MLTVSVRSVAIAQAQMGPKLVSVTQNSGVSAIDGGFECIEVYGDTDHNYGPDIQKCPLLYRKCLPLRGVH